MEVLFILNKKIIRKILKLKEMFNLIKNCYEAVNELERLSNELEALLDENIKLNGKLDGDINNIENKFLMIKHSLELIFIEGSNKSAYNLGLKMFAYKKQYDTNKNNRKFIEHKNNQFEEYKKLEKLLKVTAYTKNLKLI